MPPASTTTNRRNHGHPRSIFGKNDPRWKTSVDRATVAQFSVYLESGVLTMWTTGRFGKLTGIPTRTLQEWSKEPHRTKRGKTSGSGILPAKATDDNGYRFFDEESLYDVLAIKLAKDAGLQDAQIREITGKGGSSHSMTQHYIEQLLHERHVIDTKIRIVQAISRTKRKKFEHGRPAPEKCTGKSSELEFIVASELLDHIVDHVVSSTNVETTYAEYTQMEDNLWPAFIETLDDIRKKGSDASCDEAMAAIASFHRILQRIPYDIAPCDFARIMEGWASEEYTRIALAIQAGEDFLAFFEEAIGAYGRIADSPL
ncbi:MAG: hypothetical protein Q4B69_06790 [Slackia sp.]|nr:hypothetical protein [Slackia sp.]